MRVSINIDDLINIAASGIAFTSFLSGKTKNAS